ncbi:MAG: F0F1 ATP synthase subunit A [Gemmataceae bacterium]
MAHDPMDHVKDADTFHVFDRLFDGVHIHLPNILGFQITKYMVLELLAAGLVVAIYVPLARRAQSGEPPKGSWWNCFESLLTFIRNDVARPNLGEKDADHYVPFLWTLFLFILFCNLLGMFPYMGSPTANIWVTGALGICAFFAIHGSPIARDGASHYLKSQWPHIHLGHGFVAEAFGTLLSLMIFTIEMLGTVIKSFVLAVRLFANMFAGHMVLASILLFIVIVGTTPEGHAKFSGIWLLVTLSSFFGTVALSLLELFVAFLQAYIFVFLTALFMGMALHPEH